MLDGALALALAAGAAACAGAARLAVEWRRLEHMPALTPSTRAYGIAGCSVQAGTFSMFHRMRPGPPSAANYPPVVLVHGLVVSSRYMEPLACALSRNFRVYAPDLPGFGESACLQHLHRPPLSVVELAHALHLWLQTCRIERAMFVGNSFGCQVLAELAVRYPDVVDRLVLQGPTTDRCARSLPRQIARALINGRRERRPSPAPVARIDYAKAGIRYALAAIRMAMRDRIEDRLSDIVAPTLVVRGTRDSLVTQRWAEEVAGQLPNGELLVIAGGTHTLNFVYPESFAFEILPFLLRSHEPVRLVDTVSHAGAHS
ncbi:pimeloyl-ACP methyl ester carboxylesterase [Trinickia symbiotica]|uniref:Alpha/beta hydrolase n=1 Tax=Trinickia symbiotica TaxID=863227 RepID=A0A2N7WZF3_9BURK|nr:alpha/beta hydrolase [Trinickia symbiotica]PMS34876.1 alpha/beta hydrolase [Trinickia symbiotica]PPK45098.1 pimeloyl-ACP methyl ester carboxylesterase [Trinickia symbiotica]